MPKNRFVESGIDFFEFDSKKKPRKSYTPEQKKEIWNRYSQKTLKQEELFKKAFENIYQGQKKEIVKSFESSGTLPGSLDDNKTAEKFKSVIELIYSSGYEDAVPKQFDLLDERALEWISTRSLLLAKSINKTTLDTLRSLLAEGFEKGESIRDLTKRIEGYFDESEKWRAEACARTETLTASNRGAIDRYKAEGIEEFEWLAAPDSCEECVPLDGQRFPIDSGEQPPRHVNCRCSVLSVIPE